MIELDGASLEAMSPQEIAAWAWNNLGVAFDPNWPKSKMLDQLVRKFASEIVSI